jgi:photosystem II stability/assembly factor-like uncharacterized protein
MRWHVRLFLVLAVTVTTSVLVVGPADAGTRERHYTNVYFWTPDAGWIADPQEILLTRDGGATWVSILSLYHPTQSLGSVGRIGVLTPQLWWYETSGYLRRTTDQGRTWTSQKLPNLRGIVFVTPADGWGIQGGGGALYRTQDAGRTWQPVPLPGIDTRRLPIRRLTFLSPQVGWAEVGDGSVAQTSDGGRTWTLRGRAPGGFRLFHFVNSQTGFALDLRAPKIYRTQDGGATWGAASLPPLPAAGRLDNLFALDAMTAWAVSGGGAILRTVDGGATWQLQPSGTQLDLAAIHFADRQHGWAVGFANTVLKTADGGLTWTPVQVNVP